MLTPRIETLTEKKLIGIKLRMSLMQNKTAELWQSFMKSKNQITNSISDELFSLQIYNETYFTDFNLENEFEKLAAIEVTDFDFVPDHMESYVLLPGLYAVFHYKGSSADNSIYQYIYGVWLPNSMYNLDHRPHFEILGAKYKNNDPNSEEEIWIPITLK